MTSGSKGLHVAVPLIQEDTFDEVHDFTKNVSLYICKMYPNDFTTTSRKNKREGKLYVDFLRNSYAQTSVCPFSVRAIEYAPVATPIDWGELDDKNFNPQIYTIKNIFDRLEKVEDSWRDFTLNSKSIGAAKVKLIDMCAY